MSSDIRLISSTQAIRVNTSTEAQYGQLLTATAAGILAALTGGVALPILIGTLAGGLSIVYGTTALNGYVRLFHFKDLSTGESRVEQYIYMSKTDADNDNGGEFLGAVDKYANLYRIDIKH
jgi:hypothetical protein